jgi:hypothetical protein
MRLPFEAFGTSLTTMLSNAMNRSHCTALAAAMALAACSAPEPHLEFHASIHEGEVLAGLEIWALPFDPDRLLDSLARTSGSPRPEFPELEEEMSSYLRPDQDALLDIGTSWRATQDSVRRLADSLNQESPRSPGYAAAYERLRQQYQRLAQRAVERDAAFREQVGDDRELATRATAAADSLRAWEHIAYADFADLADTAVARAGREPMLVVTDSDGKAELVLEAGAWWLIAKQREGENPFRERYWNVPLVMSAVGPRVAPLYSGNSVTRWRH